MMRLRSLFFLAGCLAGLCLSAGRAADAGGPTLVSRDGRPCVWNSTRPVRYTVDPGPLGHFSNTQAAQWVEDAFRRWASVDGVALPQRVTYRYSRDITGENFLEVQNRLASDESVVIFDADGTILDILLGEGGGDTAGGGTVVVAEYQSSPRLQQATIILSGRRSTELTPERWQWVIQHEVGHALGLNHSQVNPQVTYDGDSTNDALAPCMSYFAGPNGGPTLHADDRAWIAALYPRAGQPARTGTIRGRVLLPDGKTGLQGIQVVAYRDGDEAVTAVSGISGYRYKSQAGQGVFGSRDVALQGLYELPGLPPGNYRLAIEQLADSPRMRPRHAFLPGGRRFWTESGPPTREAHAATLVAVAAGQVIEGRDFLLEGPSQPPRAVAEVEPNDSIQAPQSLTLPAIVSGRVGSRGRKSGEFSLLVDSRDAVEDWYRIVVTEPTTLSATLTAAHLDADLNLYLVTDPSGSQELSLVERSVDRGTPPETIQFRVGPGVYFVGVSSFDEHPVVFESDYRLTLHGVPSPDLPAPDPLRIPLCIVSDVTTESFRVSWQTDQDASTVLHVGYPWREQGSPALVREHAFAVTGLSAATEYFPRPIARAGNGDEEFWPRLRIQTAQPSAGSEPDLVLRRASARRDHENREFVLGLYITNRGNGPAGRIRIERLDLASGWSFLAPPALPIDLGSIGPGGVGVVAVQVIRTAAEPAPLDMSLEGSFTTPQGATRSFRR